MSNAASFDRCDLRLRCPPNKNIFFISCRILLRFSHNIFFSKGQLLVVLEDLGETGHPCVFTVMGLLALRLL